jgi:integrase
MPRSSVPQTCGNKLKYRSRGQSSTSPVSGDGTQGSTRCRRLFLALDPFTLAALRAHVGRLDQERRGLGPEYQDHGVLFCLEDGRPPHPDTITRRFKKLAVAAGLPEIELHDVRHSCATAGRDAKIIADVGAPHLTRRVGLARSEQKTGEPVA